MKRRLYILLSLALLGSALFLLFRALSPPLPTYKGQSLDVWFEKLPMITPGGGLVIPGAPPGYGSGYKAGAPGGALSRIDEITFRGHVYGSTNDSRQALAAIQTIGANALPFIMSKFTRRESQFLVWLESSASKLGLRLSLVRDANIERHQAASALLILGPHLPSPIEDELKTLSQDKDQRLATAAKFVLEFDTGERKLPYAWLFNDL